MYVLCKCFSYANILCKGLDHPWILVFPGVLEPVPLWVSQDTQKRLHFPAAQGHCHHPLRWSVASQSCPSSGKQGLKANFTPSCFGSPFQTPGE